MNPTVIMTPIGNARERYDAMCKGRQPPPKQTVMHELPEEVMETFLDRLAAVLAGQYKKDVEEGRI